MTEEDEKLVRPKQKAAPVAERVKSFMESELGYDLETACGEARRCLRCDL
jgi:hypothetical protein